MRDLREKLPGEDCLENGLNDNYPRRMGFGANAARMRGVRVLLLIFLVSAPAQAQRWSVQTSGLDTNLRGVSVVHSSHTPHSVVVWACGSNGVILRSNDAGKTWKQLHVAGGETLDFRGIVAFGDGTAYAMSIGGGEQSRIYKTTDAGETWKLEYSDKRGAFFLDDLACISKTNCFALSDPVDGKFLLVSTEDGEHWKELPRDNMPAAIAGEGVFAAGNSTLAIYGRREMYFATGGGRAARVFHSPDLGRTWTVSETPVASGNASSGIFSIARNGKTVAVVGGDYKDVNRAEAAAAVSTDDGATWKLASRQPGGFRSAVAFADGGTMIAAGPSGEDASHDGGATWTQTDSLNLNAVAVLSAREIWGVGPKGTIARMLNLRR